MSLGNCELRGFKSFIELRLGFTLINLWWFCRLLSKMLFCGLDVCGWIDADVACCKQVDVGCLAVLKIKLLLQVLPRGLNRKRFSKSSTVARFVGRRS